jgi:ribosomal-protein-alanine N-acetyltransferase
MNVAETRTGMVKPLSGTTPEELAQLSLRNQTVTLGPLLPDDIPRVFHWMNDVEAASTDLAFRPLDWSGYLAWLADLSKNPTRVFFSIRSVVEPRTVGFLTLSNIHAVHRSAELGLRIGNEAERGRGFGRSAVQLALVYAFDHLNLMRVHLTVFAQNTRAIRSYESVGFELEGRLRRAAFIQGKWTDVLLMSVLRPASRPSLVALSPSEPAPAPQGSLSGAYSHSL